MSEHSDSQDSQEQDFDDDKEDKRTWFLTELDDYANWSQDIITASRSIYNKRKQIHKYQEVCEDFFERFSPKSVQHKNAKVKLEDMLFNLSRCITYWSYMLLARRKHIQWDSDIAPRFGIKPAMKYTDKRFLMSIETVISGNVYNWKADFQGDTNFPTRLENFDSFKDFISAILGRVDSYIEKLKQKHASREKRQEGHGRYQRNTSQNPAEKNLNETLYTLKNVMTDALKKIANDRDELELYHKNTLHSQLGRRFHGQKNNNEASIHDQDGDITHNTKKRVYFRVDGDIQIEKNGTYAVRDYVIELVKHFPYRRNRGVHMDTENERTVKWINNILPHVSKGWFEILVRIDNKHCYKIQLTPWERRNTTFVRPFVLVAHEIEHIFPDKSNEDTVPSDISDNRLIDFNQNEVDFRSIPPLDFHAYKIEPYIIHGKGTEIDAMVHSLRALKNVDETHLSNKVENDIEWIYQETRDNVSNYEKIFSDEKLMKKMRAYFSSDAKTGIVGDKSVFFFNIQGVIAGVEMYAPSLPPFVDLQGKSGNFGRLPRNQSNRPSHFQQYSHHHPAYTHNPSVPSFYSQPGSAPNYYFPPFHNQNPHHNMPANQNQPAPGQQENGRWNAQGNGGWNAQIIPPHPHTHVPHQHSQAAADFSDKTEDYLLRQCFDDPPASQRLPAQPRKLAAPVRTFAPWKPPAAGVSW